MVEMVEDIRSIIPESTTNLQNMDVFTFALGAIFAKSAASFAFCFPKSSFSVESCEISFPSAADDDGEHIGGRGVLAKHIIVECHNWWKRVMVDVPTSQTRTCMYIHITY